MSKFDPVLGPVTVVSIASRVNCEVFHAMQRGVQIGSLRMDWTRAGAHVQATVGHGHGEYMPHIVKRFESTLAYTGRITPFGDFWDMVAYDTPYRTVHADWFFGHRPVIDCIYTVTQSKLVHMGCAVANIASGGLFKSWMKRDEFDKALAAAGLPVKRPPM
jgi:hypothetical protein